MMNHETPDDAIRQAEKAIKGARRVLDSTNDGSTTADRHVQYALDDALYARTKVYRTLGSELARSTLARQDAFIEDVLNEEPSDVALNKMSLSEAMKIVLELRTDRFAEYAWPWDKINAGTTDFGENVLFEWLVNQKLSDYIDEENDRSYWQSYIDGATRAPNKQVRYGLREEICHQLLDQNILSPWETIKGGQGNVTALAPLLLQYNVNTFESVWSRIKSSPNTWPHQEMAWGLFSSVDQTIQYSGVIDPSIRNDVLSLLDLASLDWSEARSMTKKRLVSPNTDHDDSSKMRWETVEERVTLSEAAIAYVYQEITKVKKVNRNKVGSLTVFTVPHHLLALMNALTPSIEQHKNLSLKISGPHMAAWKIWSKMLSPSLVEEINHQLVTRAAPTKNALSILAHSGLKLTDDQVPLLIKKIAVCALLNNDPNRIKQQRKTAEDNAYEFSVYRDKDIIDLRKMFEDLGTTLASIASARTQPLLDQAIKELDADLLKVQNALSQNINKKEYKEWFEVKWNLIAEQGVLPTSSKLTKKM